MLRQLLSIAVDVPQFLTGWLGNALEDTARAIEKVKDRVQVTYRPGDVVMVIRPISHYRGRYFRVVAVEDDGVLHVDGGGEGVLFFDPGFVAHRGRASDYDW